MKITTSRRIAALATGFAVVAGSTLLVAGSASAFDYQVTPDELQGSIDPATATGWYEALPADQVGAPAEITDAGLVLTGDSQIMYAYDAPEPATISFQTLLTSANFVSSLNAAYFQVQVRVIPGDVDSTTTVSASLAGPANIPGPPWQASTDDLPGIPANTPVSIEEISAAIGNDYEILGFGVKATAGSDDVVQSITYLNDTYSFVAPVAAVPSVQVTPDTIFFSDVRPGGAGFGVTAAGFTPGDTLSIAVTDPNGEIFGSADGANTVIADENGGFVAEGLTLEGEGIQVGTYTFSVTDTAGRVAADSIAVIADPVAAGAPVVPTLADTGSDSGVLVGGAAALLLLGAAGMLVAAARRKGAQVAA
ncbi:hypothetical protein ASF83_00490 [Plantibacter sp. Leaf171]|uniref:hypothetical protein n=1 Tax=unclassified Plantibacter TaxID=2624265 RepID=UPI0006F87504|nr:MULTISPECIES: hypothetical protein [unclassified Plantibacter]KQM17646.1 hypothetical protein ASE44_00505 [Plantibacter sp. Leaf1]KQQ49707.1 hypothetical protein ASF68_17915 [Plantibacter sp. Leaf314]KQR60426.1 hypothetical protein ASF83_00490 [Plantibacter sp. Leaf171]